MNHHNSADFARWPRRWLLVLGLLSALRSAALDGARDPTFQAPFLAPIPNLIVVQSDGGSLVSFGSAGGTGSPKRYGNL